MKKKIWAVVLAIALLLTSFPPLAAEAKEASASLPSDIKGHVHEPVLRDWIEHDRLAGYEDGKIKPNAKVTRAEFIALVNRTFGYKEMADISRFKDVGRDAWYHDDIAKAVQAGYIAGTSATTMSPDDFITQEQVVVIAGRLGSHIKATNINKAVLAEYTKGVADWARADVEKAILSGILNPKIEGISYFNPFSRANSIALLDRVLNKKRSLTVPGDYELGDVKQLIIDSKDVTVRNGNVSEAFIATDDAKDAELIDVEIAKDACKAISERVTVEMDGTPVTTLNTPEKLNGQPDVSKIDNTILKGKSDKNDKEDQSEKENKKVKEKKGGKQSTADTKTDSSDKKPADDQSGNNKPGGESGNSGDNKPGDESGNTGDEKPGADEPGTGDEGQNESDAQKALKARIVEAEKTLKNTPTILPVMDHLKQAIDRAAEVAKKNGQADDAYNNAKTALDHAIEAYTSRPENTLVYFPEKATFRDGDWVAAATGFRADSVQMVVKIKDNKITDMCMTDYSDDHFIGTQDYYHHATQFLIKLKEDVIDQHGGDIDRFLKHYRSMEAMRIRYYDRGTRPAGDNNDVPIEYRRENGRSDRQKAKADQPPVFFDAYSGATCTCSGVSAALAKGLAKAYTAEHGDGNMITEIRFHDPTTVKDKKTQLIEGLYWLNYKEGETFDPNDVPIDIVHLNGEVETVGFADLAKNGITLEMQTHLSKEDSNGNHTIVTPVTGPIKAEHDKKGNVFVWKHDASSTKLSMKFNVEYNIKSLDVLKVQYQIGKTMDPNGEWKDFEPYYEYQILNPDDKGYRGIKTSINHVNMKKPDANASEEEKNAYAEKERKLYASKKYIKVDRSHKGEKIFLRAFLDDGREVVFRAYKKYNYEPEVADNSKVIGEESDHKPMWEVPGEDSDSFPAEISNKDYHERVAAESVKTEVQSLTFDVGKDLTNKKYNTENMGINQRAIQIDLIFTGDGGEDDYAKTPLGVKWHDTTMFNGEERNIREGHTAVSGTVVATLSGYDSYRFETRTIGSGSAVNNGLFVIDGNQLKIGNLEELSKRSEFKEKINTDKTPYTLKGGDYAVNMVGVEAGGKASKPVSSVHKLDEEDLESGAICDLHINSIHGETAELQALRYYIGDEKPASDADYTTIALPKGMSIEKYGNNAPRIKIRVPASQLGKKVFFKIVPIEEESKNAIDPELGHEYKPLTLDETAGAGTPALIGFTRPGYGDSVQKEDEYRLSVSSGIDDFMSGEGSSASYRIQFYTGNGPEPTANPTSDYVTKDRGDFNTFYEEAFERIKEPKPNQLPALGTDTPVGTAVVTFKGVLDPSLGEYKLKFVSPDSDTANEFALDGNTLKVAKPLTAGKKTVQIVGEHKSSGKYTNMMDLSELMAPVKDNGSPQPAEETITLKTVQIIPFIKADADDPGEYNKKLYAEKTVNAPLKTFVDKPFAYYLLGEDPGNYVPKFKVKVVYQKGTAADMSETVDINEKLCFGGNYTVTLDGGESFKLSTDKLKPLVTSLSVAYVDDFDAEPAADAWIPVDLAATHEAYDKTGSAEPIEIEFPAEAAGKFVKLKYDAPSGLSPRELDNYAVFRKLDGAENNKVSLTVEYDSSYDSFTYRFAFKKAGGAPAGGDEPGVDPSTPAYTMELIGTVPKQTVGKPFDGGSAILVLKNTEDEEIRRVSLTDAFADETNFVVEGWNGDKMVAYEGAVQDEVEYYYICDKKQYDAHPGYELYDIQSATAVDFKKAASSEDTSGDDGDILDGFDMRTVKSIELDGDLPEQTEGEAFNAGDALLLLKDEDGKELKRVPLAKALADNDRFKVVYIADLGDYTYREDAYDGTYRSNDIYDFVILEKAEYERIKNDEKQELIDVIYEDSSKMWPLAASIKDYLEKN